MRSERRRIWKCLLFVVLVTLLAFVSGGCAADTYTVCPTGCSYTSIQDAVNASQPGDTIEVHSGTYYENVDVNKQLILRGINTGGGKPVVDAGGSGSAITLNANGIMVDGFTAINASGELQAGILVYSNNNIVINSTATNNYYGILLYSSSTNTLTSNTASNNYWGIFLDSSNNNSLTDNTANSNNATGIYLYSSSDNNLNGNTATNNEYCILMVSSSNNTLTGNTALNNSYDGICLYSSNNNTLTGNTASNNNAFGIYLESSSNNNTLTGNTAANNTYVGIGLSSSSNNTLTGNTANNSIRGIYLYSSSNNNTLIGNTASDNNNYGILLDNLCNNNTLTGNIASNNQYGIILWYSSNNALTGNTAHSNIRGIHLYNSSTNLIYNNYFNNTNNAWDDGNNIWNISKTPGTNIAGGLWLGGNYWSDYNGEDTNDDGLGDTLVPYNSSGNIVNGGDWLPLVISIQIGSLTGTLTFACNGTGIPVVVVNLTQNGGLLASTTSDATGRYSFTNLSVGVYAVNVSKRRYFDNNSILTIEEGESAVVNLTLWLKGDLNNNCIQADAGDLAKLKDASVGKIAADWRFDLNSNLNNADAGDLAKLKDASVGKIDLV